MEDLIRSIFMQSIWCFGIVIGIQHVILKPYVLYQLKNKHNELWRELGSPHFWQSREFSDDFVRFSKNSSKLLLVERDGNKNLLAALKGYQFIERLVQINLAVCAFLLLILLSFKFL
ncbi:MAG: hypothetical protein ACPGR2_04430 [Psychrobium sp.]